MPTARKKIPPVPVGPPQYCVRCGRGTTTSDPVQFRSPYAMKCMACDEDTVEERKEYHRLYHKARGSAIKDLIDSHPAEFETLLAKHRERIEEAEAAQA